jgi:hypothetical protein
VELSYKSILGVDAVTKPRITCEKPENSSPDNFFTAFSQAEDLYLGVII